MSHMIELIAALIGSIIFALASFGMQAFALLNHSDVQPSASVPECQMLPITSANEKDASITLLNEIQNIIQAIEDIPTFSSAPISLLSDEDNQPLTISRIYTHRFSPGSLF